MNAQALLLSMLTLTLPSFAGDSSSAARTGAQVYKQHCVTCHATGWNGAPISGVERDWKSRIAAGRDVMLNHTRQGVNAMPPMGTCSDCSEDELWAAIESMLGGAAF